MIAIVFLFVFCAGIAVAFARVYKKARRLTGAEASGNDWEMLVASLEPVPFDGLEIVALDHLQPRGYQLKVQPAEMWDSVGGLEGLRRMRRNADRMIQLAGYIRRWNFDESVIVAERMRHDAVILKRAISHIEMRLLFRRQTIRVPFYVHQAASSYYLLTRRVLALYEANQYILYPRLAAAL